MLPERVSFQDGPTYKELRTKWELTDIIFTLKRNDPAQTVLSLSYAAHEQ